MRLTEYPDTSAADPAVPEQTPIQPATLTGNRAKAAAEKFEAFFIADMLHRMRRSAREFADREEVGGGRANDDMLDIADSMVADKLAGQHAFGVADLILRQILPGAGAAKPVKLQFNSAPSAVALKK